MAINYTISYTFTAGTTISSSQVNTNFSDNANTWVGLEALTKSFAALRVDATPTSSTDVTIKSYVDKLNSYRRPVLLYSSGTVVNMETGINGTSGQALILFPDGTSRTDSTTGRINCNLAQVAALTVTAQSGLRTGSVANNTWYAVYAVKSQVNSTDIVAVADVVLPIQANFATLNSNFGTSSWVYLGMIRYGDQSATANAILKFRQSGHITMFLNSCVGNVLNAPGIRFATTASAASATWAYATGTSGAVAPNHVLVGSVTGAYASSANAVRLEADSGVAGNTRLFTRAAPGASECQSVGFVGLENGLGIAVNSGSVAQELYITGIVDSVLGVGASPLL